MSKPRIQLIKEMLEKESNDSFLNYALALEHIALNDLSQAERIIENIIRRDENYLGAYYQLGKLYEQTNNINEAIHIYKKGIGIATHQNNQKTTKELQEALANIT